jgi:two-component system chemotaxis response regulator CheY
MSDGDNSYKGVTVLVVDDEEIARTSIRGQLRQIGIPTVVEAADGKTALVEIARARPNLVLCDVHMQPMDGREFLKTVRTVKVEWVKRTPVIFVTADANRDTVSFAKEYDVSGYLVKPIALEALKAKVDAVLKSGAKHTSRLD